MVYSRNKVYTLYIIYFVFLFSVFFKTEHSALHEYISTVIIILILFFVLVWQFKYKFTIKNYLVPILLLIGYFILLLPFVNTYKYSMLLYMEVLLIIIFFSKNHIKMEKIVTFINVTYFIYLFLSILAWLGIFPNIIYDPAKFLSSKFYIDFGFVGWHILPGFNGTPAGLDIYSTLVLIINILYNKSITKSIMIAFAILGIVLTFRFTSFMVIILVAFTYYFFKSKSFSIILLFSIMSSFLLVLYLLHIDYSFTIFDTQVDVKYLGYVATHARTMIWTQQIEILLDNYTLFDYIFGDFSRNLFGIEHYQLSGELLEGKIHENSHNTYLLLFFRTPLLFIIFFSMFIYTVFTNYNKKRFTIIFLLIFAAFTNSAIVSLSYPIFLIILIYFAMYKESNEKQSI